MDPATLGLIRESIPESVMNDNRIKTLLYTGAALLKLPEDISDRAAIVTSLGYDPEEKWR